MKKSILILSILFSGIAYSQYECDSAKAYLIIFNIESAKAAFEFQKNLKTYIDLTLDQQDNVNNAYLNQVGSRESVDAMFSPAINMLNASRYLSSHYTVMAQYYYNKALPFIRICQED